MNWRVLVPFHTPMTRVADHRHPIPRRMDSLFPIESISHIQHNALAICFNNSEGKKIQKIGNDMYNNAHGPYRGVFAIVHNG